MGGTATPWSHPEKEKCLSRSADIDFRFAAPVVVSGLLNELAAAGCSLSYRGEVGYVFDEDQMFDWARAEDSRVADLLARADALPDSMTVGFTILVDVPSEAGGDLLFQPGRAEVSLMASVNRRKIARSAVFTDLGWYLNRLVPVLEPLGLVEIEAKDLA
ncbi:hypothetical protein [Amycolatopsis sp. NPDC051102]|uniref:hypothetical protein n=1 Tax=Amycolatopsis sp. NPDC051102 TaxID=3155163 RepID=UPI0034383B5A